MKKKLSPAFFSICVLILCSCISREKNTPLVIPAINNNTPINNLIGIDDIIETKNGTGNADIPAWLLSFNNGGIAAVENMEQYNGKYCFIGRNGGVNFEALLKWADNYSTAQAFTRLAAARIENRLTSTAALYPDDEYGAFYEKLIKKSFDAEYRDASAEDTYWVKKMGTSEANGFQDTYEFFAFISIDKKIMQDVIKSMIAEVYTEVTPTRAQNNAIYNIQKNFFEGF
jgi:hypothetical protein